MHRIVFVSGSLRATSSLPDDVLRLQRYGLTIRGCEDLGSYKKIIPELASKSGDFLLIADDDVYYPPHWLHELVGAYRPGRSEVLCGRAHRMRLDKSGIPLPYLAWEGEISQSERSQLLFPTGIGGVLYEPNIFHANVTRAELFRELCPTADDIWLYWMAALNGARFRKIGPRRHMITWPRSQHVALHAINATANDEQIANMIARYGFPAAFNL